MLVIPIHFLDCPAEGIRRAKSYNIRLLGENVDEGAHLILGEAVILNAGGSPLVCYVSRGILPKLDLIGSEVSEGNALAFPLCDNFLVALTLELTLLSCCPCACVLSSVSFIIVARLKLYAAQR